MNDSGDNIQIFTKIYDFQKKNYNFIIHGPSGIGKFEFILNFLDYYNKKFNIPYSYNFLTNPDIYYASLPILNSSNSIVANLLNDHRILFEYGLINDIDGNKIGQNINIDQIREISHFTSLSSTHNHKIIIINTCDFLSKESSAALLKTLEESKSQCIFFLLSNNLSNLDPTIISRCQKYTFSSDHIDIVFDTFSSYFYSKIPFALEVFKKFDITLLEDSIIDELNLLFNKKQNYLDLSETWKARGHVFLDYLIELFLFLIKSKYINNKDVINLRNKILKHINIKDNKNNTVSYTSLVKVLLSKKRESDLNLNPKLFYDNLLIELRDNL